MAVPTQESVLASILYIILKILAIQVVQWEYGFRSILFPFHLTVGLSILEFLINSC